MILDSVIQKQHEAAEGWSLRHLFPSILQKSLAQEINLRNDRRRNPTKSHLLRWAWTVASETHIEYVSQSPESGCRMIWWIMILIRAHVICNFRLYVYMCVLYVYVYVYNICIYIIYVYNISIIYMHIIYVYNICI